MHAPLTDAAARLGETTVDDCMKGVPLGSQVRLADVGSQGWNVARGDLALPVTTLYASALSSNLQTMQKYCERHQARLAPHGKTTMAPQLFARQFEHGAWALTAATPTQVAVMRRHRVPRIILANELADERALHWIAAELDSDAEFDFFCLVDSVESVAIMDAILSRAAPERPINVLLEVGVEHGRCGVRDRDTALEVATAVRSSDRLALAGVEAYEGLVTGGDSPEDLAALDAFFALMCEITTAALEADLFDTVDVLVTAGGSSYFDIVVAGLAPMCADSERLHLVLRSGCYISHDGGKYEKLSPLAGRAAATEDLRLVNALTAWGTVLSRPEPDLVIIGIGKRDVAFDLTNPTPRTLYRAGDIQADLRGAEIFKLMDQHAFMRVDPSLDLTAGDIVAMDMSHPCTAFDKARFLPIVDDSHDVVDAVLTFF